MKALMGLITALSFPLMILNVFGGITAGIWLAVLRDWRILGAGIGLFIVSTFILGIATMPSLLLGAPAVYFGEKGKMLGFIFFCTLSSVYVLAIITVWCCGVLFLFLKDATATDFIPRLIWSYGAATGPWAYMASKEQDPSGSGIASTIAVFLAELAYLTLMLEVIFARISLFGALKTFAGFMLIGVIVQVTTAVLVQRERLAEIRFAK